jgi:hypothetical protein
MDSDRRRTTQLVDQQMPERAKALCISEQDVIKNVMLKETMDGEFTIVEDVAGPPSSWPPLGRTR